MNDKTSGVHKRGLKQRHTTKFLKDILYIIAFIPTRAHIYTLKH
jgi:hypothetical protein